MVGAWHLGIMIPYSFLFCKGFLENFAFFFLFLNIFFQKDLTKFAKNGNLLTDTRYECIFARRSYIMYQNYGTIIPASYKPISAWGYFGYRILYSIPIIGWIFLLIHAIGASNVNVRRHARSYFCSVLLIVLIAAALTVLAMVSGIFTDIDTAKLVESFESLVSVFAK